MKTIKNLAVIDDDTIFVFLAKKNIDQTKLVEHIDVFYNGMDAIDFISKNKDNFNALPEVIFLDLSMPILDGWQFLDEFRLIKNNLCRNITIYIVSSSISPDDVEKVKTYNEVTDYLLKPISKEKFAEIVDKL